MNKLDLKQVRPLAQKKTITQEFTDEMFHQSLSSKNIFSVNLQSSSRPNSDLDKTKELFCRPESIADSELGLHVDGKEEEKCLKNEVDSVVRNHIHSIFGIETKIENKTNSSSRQLALKNIPKCKSDFKQGEVSSNKIQVLKQFNEFDFSVYQRNESTSYNLPMDENKRNINSSNQRSMSRYNYTNTSLPSKPIDKEDDNDEFLISNKEGCFIYEKATLKNHQPQISSLDSISKVLPKESEMMASNHFPGFTHQIYKSIPQIYIENDDESSSFASSIKKTSDQLNQVIHQNDIISSQAQPEVQTEIKAPLFIMSVEIEDSTKIVPIYEDESPEHIAYNFCSENGLTVQIMNILIEKIKQILNPISERKTNSLSSRKLNLVQSKEASLPNHSKSIKPPKQKSSFKFKRKDKSESFIDKLSNSSILNKSGDRLSEIKKCEKVLTEYDEDLVLAPQNMIKISSLRKLNEYQPPVEANEEFKRYSPYTLAGTLESPSNQNSHKILLGNLASINSSLSFKDSNFCPKNTKSLHSLKKHISKDLKDNINIVTKHDAYKDQNNSKVDTNTPKSSSIIRNKNSKHPKKKSSSISKLKSSKIPEKQDDSVSKGILIKNKSHPHFIRKSGKKESLYAKFIDVISQAIGSKKHACIRKEVGCVGQSQTKALITVSVDILERKQTQQTTSIPFKKTTNKNLIKKTVKNIEIPKLNNKILTTAKHLFRDNIKPFKHLEEEEKEMSLCNTLELNSKQTKAINQEPKINSLLPKEVVVNGTSSLEQPDSQGINQPNVINPITIEHNDTDQNFFNPNFLEGFITSSQGEINNSYASNTIQANNLVSFKDFSKQPNQNIRKCNKSRNRSKQQQISLSTEKKKKQNSVKQIKRPPIDFTCTSTYERNVKFLSNTKARIDELKKKLHTSSTNKKPINHESDVIHTSSLQKVFSSIFAKLDKDGDDEITYINCNIKSLSAECQKILRPLFVYLNEKKVKITKTEFFGFCNSIYKVSTYHLIQSI